MAQKKITSQNAKKYAKDYVLYIKERYKLPINKAYLFGSFANGKNRDWSDIDVCIVSPKLRGFNGLTYLSTKLRGIDIDRGIEPIGIHPNDFVEENPIAYQVKHFGKALKV
ncbi:MAG: nucleotidyltransferase domain-containing protein [Candidatus Kuenenbacteria bacterium]